MLRVTSQFTPRTNLGRFASVTISPAVSAAVQESCELVQSIAKLNCPVDTGALLASIEISAQAGDATIVQSVAPGVFYAAYVEYGTGRRGDPTAPYPHVESWPGMGAQPFMRPAIDEARGQVKDIFVKAIGAAFD